MHTETHELPRRTWVSLLAVFPVMINAVQWHLKRSDPDTSQFTLWSHAFTACLFVFIGIGSLWPRQQTVKWSTDELETDVPRRRRIVWAENPTVMEDLNNFLIYPRGERGMVSLRKAACSAELTDFLRQRMAAG